LFVGVAFEFTKRMLTWYLGLVPSYSVIYGAFATLPIFLLWIYLCWVVVLLGAVIAAYAPSLQMRVKRWPDTPGARLALAVQVLRALQAARGNESRGLALDSMAQALRIDPLQIETVVDTLVAMDWVGRLDEGGAARFVLMCEPASTSAEPLLSRLLIEPLPALAGLRQRSGLDRMTLADLLLP
jgi:membrane protein